MDVNRLLLDLCQVLDPVKRNELRTLVQELKAKKAAREIPSVTQAREGGARGPRLMHDLHGGRRAADRPLRAVQPLPRLRLVRRRARRVPQLSRDDHYAHVDRELELEG